MTHVLRTVFLYPAYIISLTHQSGMACCSSAMHYQGIIIFMYPPDAEKTSFITPHGLFCYNVMPFELKNARATYQRLVTMMFWPLLGKTMEVYIDDMLVKSKERPDHTTHLQQAFELLMAYGMKLNPTKCAFGVSAGRFLGFMMT